MSTYLVAYVISDFKKISKKSAKYQIEVEIAARPEAIDNNEGDYALEVTAKVLDYFTDYFGVAYPLRKSSWCFKLFFIFVCINIFLTRFN